MDLPTWLNFADDFPTFYKCLLSLSMLFSYTMITIAAVTGLILAEKITFQGIFSDSLRMAMTGQIICGLLAVPLDCISTAIFFKDKKFKKRILSVEFLII